jgi:fructosamine-3-kinase
VRLDLALSAQEHDALNTVCRHVFGTRCTITSYRIMRRSADYLVLLADLTAPTIAVVLKLAGPGAVLACPFDRTAAIMRRVQSRMPRLVAETLAVDVSYHTFPWRYLITTQLPGVRWNAAWQHWTAVDRPRLWRQLGESVALLHSHRFPAYGEISADGTIAGDTSYLSALLARAERRLGNPERLAIFRAALAGRDVLFARTDAACLSHEDLNPTNLLVAFDDRSEGWHLSGIVDFDSAWAGSADADLARLALWEGMTGDGFWTGYGQIRPLTPSEEERRLVHQLLWCLEYASPTPRHHADTGRICAALGLPVIRFD